MFCVRVAGRLRYPVFCIRLMEDINLYRSPRNCIGSKNRPNPCGSYIYLSPRSRHATRRVLDICLLSVVAKLFPQTLNVINDSQSVPQGMTPKTATPVAKTLLWRRAMPLSSCWGMMFPSGNTPNNFLVFYEPLVGVRCSQVVTLPT